MEGLLERVRRVLKPRIFDVEACGACNLDCVFCPRASLPSEMRTMSEETFESFLQSFSPSPPDVLVFAGIGEPTLNLALPRFIERARARARGLHTWVTTNGTQLDSTHLPPILEAGLGTLDVSFNGVDAETYGGRMRGSDFDRVLDNIDFARKEIERRGHRTRLQINFIVSERGGEEEERSKQFWRRRGIDQFQVHRAHDRAGVLGRVPGLRPVDRPGLRSSSCKVFERILFVAWTGEIHCCCHDIRREHPLGNVHADDRGSLERKKADVIRRSAWPEICGACVDPLRHDLDAHVREMFFSGLLHAARARSRG